MRNEVSHHILVTDKVFEENKTNFLKALEDFKEVEDDESNNIPDALKNDLVLADFEQVTSEYFCEFLQFTLLLISKWL